MQYHTSNLRQQQYQLQFDFKSVAAAGREVYIEDSCLKTSTLLDCSGTARYTFTVNNDTASGQPDRFVLVFGKKKSIGVSTVSDQKITVSPNPADGHYFNLHLHGFNEGFYKMKLPGQKGEVLYIHSGIAAAGNSIVKIMLKNKPSAGIYTVELLDANNRRFTDRIIFR